LKKKIIKKISNDELAKQKRETMKQAVEK